MPTVCYMHQLGMMRQIDDASIKQRRTEGRSPRSGKPQFFHTMYLGTSP
jgi:hypothetical protein